MNQNCNQISIQHKFDTFCKKVLRNEVKNIRKRVSRMRKKEESLNYLNKIKYQEIQYEERSSYLLLGMEILISDNRLSEEIDKLSEIKRKIILLYYFAGFNDQEIARLIRMSTSGVWYQRSKAIEQLRIGYNLW